MNGITKATQKAMIVGNAKRAKYFFIDFCMVFFSYLSIKHDDSGILIDHRIDMVLMPLGFYL
ncbi:hypothetical protein YSY43_00020 [Paenibacillus sp. YSY-4.3]